MKYLCELINSPALLGGYGIENVIAVHEEGNLVHISISDQNVFTFDKADQIENLNGGHSSLLILLTGNRVDSCFATPGYAEKALVPSVVFGYVQTLYGW